MGKVNYTTEQNIVKLREVEVLCSQGKTISEAVRQIGVSEQIYYRWRNMGLPGRRGRRRGRNRDRHDLFAERQAADHTARRRE